MFLLTCVYLCLLYFFQAEYFFSPGSLVGGYGSVTCQENSQNPFRKETRLHALLKGAAHDIIHTHPLSLWPCCCVCCVLFLFLSSPIGLCLCVYAHKRVFCKHGKLFPHLLWLASKTLQPFGLSSPHTVPACTSSFPDYLGSHWLSIVCYTDMLFVYRGS